ncbi:MAG: dUTP diphosphatase [Rhodospirillaceae bacterium]|jgi:dUTP pyrophosphatase|nr:dUTP diphosphatase [Rhodospirillaceae bacterium]MBT6118617.1 dUTP diphosphatase [Rhodospirillaceae bacterium]
MTEIGVALRRLPHGADLPLPAYATPDSAGLDLHAAVAETLEIAPGGRHPIPTGLSIALPTGFEAQIRPRSGLAARHGITVLNSPGTIDADYRGEIAVLLVNLGAESFAVERGMRIAQLVVAPVARIAWDERADLPDSTRGGGGFGSTGTGSMVERDGAK